MEKVESTKQINGVDVTVDYKKDRENDVNTILNCPHPKKVIVAGPGTGKSYLFQEVIKKKKKEGKKKFLAITFIGKLCDELADDLAGLADTKTLHGFAREFVISTCPEGWQYYPEIKSVVEEDLKIKGIKTSEIGNENYKERTLHYKAIGHDDVIYYAVQICKKEESKIPKYDLILVDEFQDFNESEAEFIDLLAKKNEMLVVGDDDQALHEWKGSFSKFIRDKYDKQNTEFKSHTLKYCSRCTETIINAFHSTVKYFKDKGKLDGRIDDKKYICYPPDKKEDSESNQKILLFEDVAPGMAPTKIRYELANVLEEQKIKSVLIIGEGRTCKKILSDIAKGLREFGFKNVSHPKYHHKVFTSKSHVITGYKILNEGSNNILGWRILLKELEDNEQKKKIILENYDNAEKFIEALPKEFRKKHEEIAKTFKGVMEKPESGRNQIALSSIEKLHGQVVGEEKEKRHILINQLIDENKYLTRPLANLNITVCNILGSKGLEADVVFLVGFDEGKLPMKNEAEDSEIYQMLVALTRAKKRVYLINTKGKRVSKFIDCINNFVEKV